MNRNRGSLAVLAAGVLLSLTATPAYAEEPASGRVTGHVVTEQPGSVTVNLWTTDGASGGQVLTGADGTFSFDGVPVGTYKIQYGFLGRFQWSHAKLGFSTADVVTVSAGQVTTVPEETMFRPGTVEVVATDATTGAPVDAVCAGVQEWSLQCGVTDGRLRLENLADGTYTLHVRSSDGLHARQEVKNVKVVLGQVTRVEVALRATTAITTTVVDRATGEPVPNTCVAVLPTVFGALDDRTCQWDVNYTDAQGRVTVGELEPGEYRLLVLPDDGAHGIQWVGRKGGVGRQQNALAVTGEAGRLSTVATVRLDPPASITGTIQDAGTGEPLGNGCAGVLPTRQAGYVPGVGRSCAGSDGVYTVGNLGPYDWPLEFTYFYSYIEPYASVWSGGAPDRKQATPVRAGIDQPGVASDVSLARTGPRLTVDAVSQDGQPYRGWLAGEIYNARTGDLVKEFSATGPAQVDGLAEQPVKIRYVPSGPWVAGWYGGTDLDSAKSVRVRPDKLTRVTVVLAERD